MCYVQLSTRPDTEKEIVKNYVEMYCSSYAGAPGPEQRKTCENMNISLLFPSFATVDLTLAVCSVNLNLHQFLTL